MSYSHLSIIERGQLEALHRLGWSTIALANQLGRHHSTIAREIVRGKNQRHYEASIAQEAYQERRTRSVPLGKFTPELGSKLREKLEQTWSPEQIAEKRRHEGQPFVCFKTIYRWIYDGKLTNTETQVLRHKRKRRKPMETRGSFLVANQFGSVPRKSEVVKHSVIRNSIPSCLAGERVKLVQPSLSSVKHASISL